MLARRINERRLGEAREEGIEIGMVKGIEIGVEKGREEGRVEGREEGRVGRPGGRSRGRAATAARVVRQPVCRVQEKGSAALLGGNLWCSTRWLNERKLEAARKEGYREGFLLGLQEALRKSEGCGGGGRQRPSLWPKRTSVYKTGTPTCPQRLKSKCRHLPVGSGNPS